MAVNRKELQAQIEATEREEASYSERLAQAEEEGDESLVERWTKGRNAAAEQIVQLQEQLDALEEEDEEDEDDETNTDEKEDGGATA